MGWRGWIAAGLKFGAVLLEGPKPSGNAGILKPEAKEAPPPLVKLPDSTPQCVVPGGACVASAPCVGKCKYL